MLLDLGAVDPASVTAALDHLLGARVVRHTAVRAGLERHSRQGRHGVVSLRQALDARSIGELPVDSLLESRMAALIQRFRLPPMEFHPLVEGFEVDFRVMDSIVLVECDGHGTHGLDRDQFEFDRIRNAHLSAAGFIIVHVTWSQVVRHPADVAERIVAVLRRWAPDLLQSCPAA
jgi:very-short-patch-repair endonuclease